MFQVYAFAEGFIRGLCFTVFTEEFIHRLCSWLFLNFFFFFFVFLPLTQFFVCFYSFDEGLKSLSLPALVFCNFCCYALSWRWVSIFLFWIEFESLTGLNYHRCLAFTPIVVVVDIADIVVVVVLPSVTKGSNANPILWPMFPRFWQFQNTTNLLLLLLERVFTFWDVEGRSRGVGGCAAPHSAQLRPPAILASSLPYPILLLLLLLSPSSHSPPSHLTESSSCFFCHSHTGKQPPQSFSSYYLTHHFILFNRPYWQAASLTQSYSSYLLLLFLLLVLLILSYLPSIYFSSH